MSLNNNKTLEERIQENSSLLSDDEISFIENNIQSNAQIKINTNEVFNKLNVSINSKIGSVSSLSEEQVQRYVLRSIITGIKTGKLPSEIEEEQYNLIGTNSNVTPNSQLISRDESNFIYSYEPDMEEELKYLFVENNSINYLKSKFEYVIDLNFKEI